MFFHYGVFILHEIERMKSKLSLLSEYMSEKYYKYSHFSLPTKFKWYGVVLDIKC